MIRFVSYLNALAALGLLAYLAYGWSFTESTFGGVVGFLSIPVLGAALFIMGRTSTWSE